jgi:hypothetical protein
MVQATSTRLFSADDSAKPQSRSQLQPQKVVDLFNTTVAVESMDVAAEQSCSWALSTATLEISSHKFEATAELERLVQLLANVEGVASVELRKLHGSFSGALVLVMTRFRADGRKLPQTVLKYDRAKDVVEEAKKTTELGPKWGAAFPHVHDVLADSEQADSWGLMQMDLCGSAVGVPGLERADAVRTMASVLTAFLGAGTESVGVVKALQAVGHGLKRWSAPTAATLNLFEYYETSKNLAKRVIEVQERAAMHVPLLPEAMTVGAFFQDFLRAVEAVDPEKLRVATGAGLSHGDFHGGNQLVDALEHVFLIDFATASEGSHSLDDLGKLLVSSLIMYLPIDRADDDAFTSLCQRLAAAPSSGSFSISPSATPNIHRLEQVIEVLWPHIEAMNCGGHGQALVWALLRYAVRMLAYAEVTTDTQRERCVLLATACAQRLLADLRGDEYTGWLADAPRSWLQASSTQLLAPLPAAHEEEWLRTQRLRAYCGDMMLAEAWQTDFISREKVHISEACIRVETQRLAVASAARTQMRGPTGSTARRPSLTGRRPSTSDKLPKRTRAISTDLTGATEVSQMLKPLFPSGVPDKLIVIGGGGTGKVRRHLTNRNCPSL